MKWWKVRPKEVSPEVEIANVIIPDYGTEETLVEDIQTILAAGYVNEEVMKKTHKHYSLPPHNYGDTLDRWKNFRTSTLSGGSNRVIRRELMCTYLESYNFNNTKLTWYGAITGNADYSLNLWPSQVKASSVCCSWQHKMKSWKADIHSISRAQMQWQIFIFSHLLGNLAFIELNGTVQIDANIAKVKWHILEEIFSRFKGISEAYLLSPRTLWWCRGWACRSYRTVSDENSITSVLVVFQRMMRPSWW